MKIKPKHGLLLGVITVVSIGVWTSDLNTYLKPGVNEGIPVKLVAPNGGEIWQSGINHSIQWSGGKGGIKIALVKDTAKDDADPTSLIIGWIEDQPDRVALVHNYAWNGYTISTDTENGPSWNIPAGTYKILIIGKNNKGDFSIWESRKDINGNTDISDSSFTVNSPVQ
ncbi:MAG: hypothetical protein A2832_00900 [Candidatus Zambryskibacteria bacterium RIFCSPHIGHO2_01_FULL_44_22b]|uniref:Uncharacterized protein n=1 Tax=Candidatus Zambryskibacteria bacterium RIFCSPHIGHO2_01_FULL_44_22b TaxID=1802737 RepID=A0A1G2T2L8_9BACT|nr:MAG: hypothetical protein A2832_00900 [Candidatus Zambryskibacteria bacterium RIFCSPHIGHO2_01_FULL_44_22b]